jgi:hypothetical protein
LGQNLLYKPKVGGNSDGYIYSPYLQPVQNIQIAGPELTQPTLAGLWMETTVLLMGF